MKTFFDKSVLIWSVLLHDSFIFTLESLLICGFYLCLFFKQENLSRQRVNFLLNFTFSCPMRLILKYQCFFSSSFRSQIINTGNVRTD